MSIFCTVAPARTQRAMAAGAGAPEKHEGRVCERWQCAQRAGRTRSNSQTRVESQRTIIAHWNGKAVAGDEVSEHKEQQAAEANVGEPARPRSPALLADISAARK